MNHLFKYLRENNDEIWPNWAHWNVWPPHSVLNGSCRDFRWKAKKDILMQNKHDSFHQLFVSVLIGILARKKKQATLSRKSYSRAFSEKENWSPESWSNLHAYENMKHMQVFSSYLKTNTSVHMIIAAHTHFFNSLSWSMWCIKRALLYPQSVTYCIFYI